MISSFSYWCGKLGHINKDCDKYYDRAVPETEISERNMPYGEWLKASPMKKIQISPQGQSQAHEQIRKSFFQKPTQEDCRGGKINPRRPTVQRRKHKLHICQSL